MTGWGKSSLPGGTTAAWRRARTAALEAAGYRCQLAIGGVCTGHATEVDHIRGAAKDPDHLYLRAVCHDCHAVITQGQAQAARAREHQPVTTTCGLRHTGPCIHSRQWR